MSTRRLKIILSLFFVFITIPLSAAAAPGRVRVQNNTVVTDSGLPLRAGHLLLYKGNWGTAGNADYYRYFKNTYKLNAVRAMIYREIRPEYTATGWYEPTEVLNALDTAVQMAKQENMYIIIDYHPAPQGITDIDGHPGDFENFWNLVAPRYKNEEHVIYEMINEPVAWTSDNYTVGAINFQKYGYNLIRSLAPDTHIILWSFANVGTVMKQKVDQAPEISYANASVGYHFYQRNTSHRSDIMECKSAYPVIMTEFLPGWSGSDTNVEQANDMTYWHEQSGISWMLLLAPPLYETNGIDIHWTDFPYPQGTPLANPSFEADKTSWTFFNDASADANQFTIITPGTEGAKSAKISLSQIGTNIQVNQKDIALKPIVNYRLRFDAKSNTGHDFSIYLHKDETPYTNYGLNNHLVQLSQEWQSFTVDFTTQNFTGQISDARLRLWFAGYAQNGDEYYLDNFSLKENTGDTQAPSAPGGLSVR